MAVDNIRKRVQDVPKPDIDLRRDSKVEKKAQGLTDGATKVQAQHAQDTHPGGRIKHGSAKQYLRMFLFGSYFFISCLRYV